MTLSSACQAATVASGCFHFLSVETEQTQLQLKKSLRCRYVNDHIGNCGGELGADDRKVAGSVPSITKCLAHAHIVGLDCG